MSPFGGIEPHGVAVLVPVQARGPEDFEREPERPQAADEERCGGPREDPVAAAADLAPRAAEQRAPGAVRRIAAVGLGDQEATGLDHGVPRLELKVEGLLDGQLPTGHREDEPHRADQRASVVRRDVHGVLVVGVALDAVAESSCEPTCVPSRAGSAGGGARRAPARASTHARSRCGTAATSRSASRSSARTLSGAL